MKSRKRAQRPSSALTVAPRPAAVAGRSARSLRRSLGFGLILLSLFAAATPHAPGQMEKLSTIRVRGTEPKVAILTFHGQVDENLYGYVERVLEQAEKDGCQIVVLDMETYGGLLESAAKIRDALLRTKLVTVTYINNRAISAGAITAIATQHIYMNPNGTFGDAAPVMMTLQGGMEEAPEKIVSNLRAEMRSTAQATGRSPEIAEAMVDKSMEITGLVDKGKLLTFTAREAVDAGFIEGTALGMDSVLNQLGEKLGFERYTKKYYPVSPAESFARFLSLPPVAMLLAMIGMVMLFVEAKIPGFGLAGGIALLCFALLFWGQSIADLAGWEEIILFVLGIGLLGLEIFVTPGFGVLGIGGIASIAASLIFAFSTVSPSDPFIHPDDFALPSLYQPLGMFAMVVVMSVVMMILLASVLPSTPLFHAVTLSERERVEEGYHSTEERTLELVGLRGRAVSPLRPAGIMMAGEEKYDVVSEGGLIASGALIEVIAVEGRRVIVREVA